MNNLIIILVFILLVIVMFMAFPVRANKATKCIVLIMRNSPTSKIIEILIKFTKKQQ